MSTRKTIGAMIGAAALLAGCNDAATEAQPSDAVPSDTMAMDAAPETGAGTGTVLAVDPAAGTVTLDHQPIPAVGWPAMTMTFKADPALLAGIAKGDKVDFDVTVRGGSGTVTALRKGRPD